MSSIDDAMISIPMDGREIEILKNLLNKECSIESSRFKISEYKLLYLKLERYRKAHHDRYTKEILKRFDEGE